MNKWLIIVSAQKNIFCEFVSVIKSILINIGYYVDIKYTPIDNDIIDGENNNIILIRGNKNNNNIKFINCKYKIFYQTEQIYKYKHFINILSNVNTTLHLFKNHFKFDTHSNKKILCPCCYHELFKFQNKNKQKNIDFLFFGANTKYRNKILNKYNILNYKDVYGEKRNNLILNSNVNLIIKAKEEYCFPQLHGTLILSNKKFLACDQMVEYFPFKPNKHFIIINNCEDLNYWLKNKKERLSFTENAYNDFKKIKMIDYIESAFKNL